MSQNTLAEYRELFKNRHGVACPLTDAQMRTALAAASPSAVLEDEWPLDPTALTAIEASVASNYPSVDISSYKERGTLQATDPVLDNASAEGFDVNFALPTGGNAPYSIQLQIAPDVTGEPGTWADEGEPQADNTEIVVTGLTAETTYHARLVVTDNVGETVTTGSDSLATGAE